MGMECPHGCGRQRVAVYITADASNPKKMSEVVATKLTCGHVVGGEEYEKFRAVASEIETDRANAIRKIEEEARKRKAAAYSQFVVGQGGQKHAE